MTTHTFKTGDVVRVDGGTDRWLIIAAAPTETGLACTCALPRWRRLKWRGTSQHEAHEATCSARRKPGAYWLQHLVTGELYRPTGADEPVHKSRLSIDAPYVKPTRAALAAGQLSFNI